ncbi:MAG: hypothetical protein OXF74_03225 [Rhodobacteraceae bacterium]|nr:hypothetical protein [Paracoccaceae bacterium]
MPSDRDEFLAQLAYAYYQKGEGLRQIAKSIGRSVSMASRLLQDARDRNLVEIRINYPMSRLKEIEAEIENKYGIEKVHVFTEPSGVDRSEMLYRFGSLAAASIEQTLRSAEIIGVSWGRQVSRITNCITTGKSKGAGTVVQASGALGALGSDHDGARITQSLAERLSYSARLMPSPLIVDTADVAEALSNSPSIVSVMRLLRSADVMFASVGAPFTETSGLARSGYLTERDLDELRSKQAVADIIGYHLDQDGEILDIEVNRRVIGISPASLHAIPNVILAVTGVDRAMAIRAALRGRYCNTLLTDRATAEALLSAD